ncbi:hypothetical protein GCM10009577_08150 [Streptomyces javensis]
MTSTEAKLRHFLKETTEDLRRTRRQLDKLLATRSEPIAIVGMACRYPGGVRSPEQLWELVESGGDAITDFPADRDWGEVPSSTRSGGFLPDAAEFDPAFFGMSPREALATDPQQRVLLELAWEALERAGIVPGTLHRSRTGVFVGALHQDYQSVLDQVPDLPPGFSATGNACSVMSGRIAYTLGLEGPAVTIDTACSSSLVALHQATLALRSGDCSLALAGGVTVMSTPSAFIDFTQQEGLAPDGRCKSFSDDADGTSFSEGAGLLVLERLSDAEREGHQVLALLRGSAVNSDGASNGLTAPNGSAQRRVLSSALDNAGLRPSDVDVVEAHGTGTRLGDPIEAGALLATYGQDRERPLLLGSLKSNIGHTQAAAGVGGVIKMVGALRHGIVPATLHVSRASSRVDWADGAVELVTTARPWPGTDRPRRAGVSSFGISGTNAHVIVEQAAPQPQTESSDEGPSPWVLSGQDTSALREQARLLDAYVSGRTLSARDIGSALALSRTHFARRALVTSREGLRALAEGEPSADVVRGTALSATGPVLVFPGQGAQWVGMAVELLGSSPVFAEAMEECAAALAPFVDWSLADVLGDEVALGRVDVVQPALFAVMVSLARLWRSFGVEPAAVVGHSQGEIAAACVAGVLSLEDAARVVCVRSRLIARRLAGRGGMVSLPLPLAEVEGLIAPFGDGLVVAAVNGPESVVVSGTSEAVAALVEREPRARRIAVDYASHSPAVQDLREELLAALGPITPAVGTVPVHSSVTGGPIDGSTMDAEYWYTNLRQPVDFTGAVSALLAAGRQVFLEMSPHPVLTMSVERTAEAAGATIAVLGTLRRGEGGLGQFVRALGTAHVHGVPVDWSAVFPHATRVDLPTYAFQRSRFWPTDPVGTVDDTPQSEGPHDMLDLVRGHVAAVLGHRRAADVPADRAFSDLGLDSLTATQLRTALSDATGLDLPISLAFDHPTPAAVAAFLAGVTDAPVRRTVAADDGDPVVIVGMACRYPGGVADPEGLWRLVVDERDVVSAFPTDRGWDLDRLMLDSATTQGGFLHDAAGFDAEFFGISPREALAMDPQQRVLLETAWEAVERTGIDPSTLRSSATGVFVGASQQEYLGAADGENAELGGLVLTGKMSAVLSGRIAYTLDLKGPAVTVDTACSSSLVALHMAAQSVRSGESTLALAGGVAVMATPFAYEEFTHQGGLAADGRCKAFSAEADGTGWAEGAGLVVLERLSAATRNGHRVLAVLRGSAVNQDGASNGLSAPNGVAQQRVIRQALANARLRPRDVDMVEAHGTGTVLGDPIEANALIAAYGQDREQPLWLGSMKSNIGHAAAAAGIGGVIKTVSALAHRLMPRTLHVTEPAPTVDWPAGVRVLTETLAWPENDRPRRAGVSSFGVSGTNVHLILEQGPDRPDEASALDTGPTGVPWPLSGRTPEALRAQAARLAAHLRDRPGLRPVDVGLSLTTSRTALACRAVAFGPDDLDRIATQDQAMRIPGPRPVLVFPGQGAQWVGMAVELLASSPVFAERMEECAAALAPFVDWSLLDVLGDEVALGRVDVVQPVLWAVMVSLAEVWRSFGVEPAAVVGHSQGEIAAACVAGVLSLEDAARVVCVRSRLIARRLAGRGGMVSLPLPLAEVEGLIAPFGDGLVVAAVNGPESVVVSGTSEAVAALVEREPRARRIAVDYASHSPAVQDLREELLAALGPITPAVGTVPVHSSVAGGPIDGSIMDAEYWYTNLREPVDFHGAVSGLVAGGFRLFLEMSPHPVLTTSIEETADTVALGTLRRGEGTLDRVYRALGEAFAHGVSVDWRPAYPGARVVDLPTYAFQHQHFWVTSPRDRVSATDRWRHRIDWSPLPEPPAAAEPGRWLVLGATGATGAPGTAWTESIVRALGEQAVQVSAEAPRAELAGRLRAQPPADGALLTPGTPVEAAAMLQALDDAGLAMPTWIATRAAVAVGSADPRPWADQAGVWGLGRVAAWEYPTHWGGLVDLPAELDEAAAARLRSLLTEEKAENQVAIRSTGLYGRRLVRAAPDAPARAWTPEGTVLITGGTGGLGAEVARWAAGRGADHLILLSRRGPDAPGAETLREACEQAGARVTFVAADVADRERMAAVFDEHPVTSVFHLAASLDDGVLDTLTPDGFATVARAKVRGAQVLDELTRGRGLSAFVLFSSISGVFGVPGLGAYAAANAMLDALAVARRAAGEQALAVAWGAWAGEGLATHVVGDERLRRMGLTAMPAKAALVALEHALNREDTTVAVFDADWNRVPAHTRDGLGTLLHELPEARGPAAVSRPDAADLRTLLAGLDAVRRTAKLRDLVHAEVADALGHDDTVAVDPRRAFSELGFDSLTSVRLRNRLTELTGLSMPVTVVFDFPTVTELGEHLAGRLGGDGPDAAELLARLETLLDEAGPDEQGTLLSGMEALLSRRRPPALATDHFASASDEEMFSFIDRDQAQDPA